MGGGGSLGHTQQSARATSSFVLMGDPWQASHAASGINSDSNNFKMYKF